MNAYDGFVATVASPAIDGGRQQGSHYRRWHRVAEWREDCRLALTFCGRVVDLRSSPPSHVSPANALIEDHDRCGACALLLREPPPGYGPHRRQKSVVTTGHR
jgi:hypothetical protein